MKKLALAAILLFVVSCGDREGYKTPMVVSGDIHQTPCKEEGGAEKISYTIDGKTIVLKHENIYMPKGTVAGIEDRNGLVSYESGSSYFYMEGDEENINLKERFRRAGSDYCYFDFSVIISNISGGEYTFSVWDESGEEVARWEDVRIR